MLMFPLPKSLRLTSKGGEEGSISEEKKQLEEEGDDGHARITYDIQ